MRYAFCAEAGLYLRYDRDEAEGDEFAFVARFSRTAATARKHR